MVFASAARADVDCAARIPDAASIAALGLAAVLEAECAPLNAKSH